MAFSLAFFKGSYSNFYLNPYGSADELAITSAGIETDSNPLTWEKVSAELVIPENTTYLAVQLMAGENVTNDTVAPEFDGHYADIPEPATWVLLCIAGLMVFCRVRKSY